MDFNTIGSVIGAAGWLSLPGSLQNEAASSAASHNREWQGDQERSAREFAERMSSTAHQREVKDLRAAGLNPILSMNSGASTPGGSAPSGAVADVVDPITPAITTAMEMTRMKQDLKKSAEEIEYIATQKKKAEMETKVLSQAAPKAEVTNKFFDKVGRPLLDKIIEATTSSTPKEKATQKYMQDFDRRMKEQPKNGARRLP